MPSISFVERASAQKKDLMETHATLDNHDRLESTLDNLVKLLETSDAHSQHVKACARKACVVAKKLKGAYVGKLAPQILNERCPQRALTLAQRVFDIPELLEMILGNMNIPAVLVAQRVSKQFYGAVESSVMLQRKLALRPESNSGYLRAPLRLDRIERLSGFSTEFYFCDTQGWPKQFLPGNRVTLKASLGDGRYIDLKRSFPSSIGSRWRQMFVFQPPPKKMNFWTNCCNHSWRRTPVPPARPTIENNTGLTVGDLYDKAKEVMAKHRRCPWAIEHDHRQDTGEVRVDVFFSAEVELEADDPMLEKKQKAMRKESDEKSARSAWAARLAAYTAAKQAAAANGGAIPSMEEFEASRNRESV